MFATLIALVPLVAGTVRVVDSARVAARNSLSDDHALLEADNALLIGMTLSWPRVQLDFDYAPRLSLIQDFQPASSLVTLLHTGDARVQYRVPRFTVALDQSVSIGEQGFLNLVELGPLDPVPGTAPPSAADASGNVTPPMAAGATTPALVAPRVTLLPGVQAVSVAAERTRATYYHRWSQRWASDARASYSFSGGSDSEARLVLPRQDLAELMTAAAYSYSEHSRVALSVTGSHIWTTQDYRYWLLALQANWSTRFAARSSVSVSIGSTRQDTRTPDQRRIEAWVPTVGASLEHRAILGRATYAGVVLRANYAPYVNVLLGKMQNIVDGTVAADIQYQRLSAALSGTLAQTLPTDALDAARSLGLSTTVSYVWGDLVTSTAGAQLVQQRVNLAVAPSSLLWIAYLSLSFQVPSWRF